MSKDLIKDIIMGVLGIALIVLLIFRIQVNVSMQQSQQQSMKTDIWNVAHNQNINLNVLHTYSTGQTLHYSNAVFEKIVKLQDFYLTLSSFQKMYTHAVSLEGKAVIFFPVLVSESKVNKVSVTNFSTNYNHSSNTNMLWMDWR